MPSDPTPIPAPSRLDALLAAEWKERSLGGCDYIVPTDAYVAGLLTAASLFLSPAEAEMWVLRFKHECPDKTHPGGQVWCAYCGDVVSADTTYIEETYENA